MKFSATLFSNFNGSLFIFKLVLYKQIDFLLKIVSMKKNRCTCLSRLPFKKQLAFFIIAFSSCFMYSQKMLNAVYSGIEFRQTINGTQTLYPSYFFRSDGTFSSQLHQEDWYSRVDGSYKILADQISMKFTAFEGETKLYIISDNVVRKNSALLYKFEITNEISAKTFKQETDYNQIQEISFDGKGTFKSKGFRNASARDEITQIDGQGTYTITNSLLILMYEDGRIVKNSFFYSGGKFVSALINGSTFNEINL